PFLNSSVSQLAGDTDIIDSVTFFRDANNRWVLGFKQNIDWLYPKVYLKKLSLHHNQTDAHEDAVVANSKVEYTTDVSTLTSVFNVPNANIVKPVDSSNVNALVPNTNNYVDTIVTANGTTAGTVYTFKRVGLSDLSLTLTAASASFSGVVTTGAQIFEGSKTFLKSPKVPNATNANEAVNKSQLDAVGNAIPDFTTYFKYVSGLQNGTDLDNVTEMGSYLVGNAGAS